MFHATQSMTSLAWSWNTSGLGMQIAIYRLVPAPGARSIAYLHRTVLLGPKQTLRETLCVDLDGLIFLHCTRMRARKHATDDGQGPPVGREDRNGGSLNLPTRPFARWMIDSSLPQSDECFGRHSQNTGEIAERTLKNRKCLLLSSGFGGLLLCLGRAEQYSHGSWINAGCIPVDRNKLYSDSWHNEKIFIYTHTHRQLKRRGPPGPAFARTWPLARMMFMLLVVYWRS